MYGIMHLCMYIELERCLDRVYRMADSISEGSSSVNEGPSSLNSSSMRFVFDALKAQALSDLTRKRSVHCNPPPKGKRRACGEGSSEPKSITAQCMLHSE